MNLRAFVAVTLLALLAPIGFANPEESSAPRASVQRGKIIGPLVHESKLYRGILRQYWVYVPAQYDPKIPPCLLVFQDGLQYLRDDGPYRAAFVLDKLIQENEIPVTIAVFVNPGYRDNEPPPPTDTIETKNRRAEYEAIDDKYVRFLIGEFLPAALKGYNVTKNAAGHALVGFGPGGLAAWTAAWERPEYFQKVITHGANLDGYTDKVREAARKPIRMAVRHTFGEHKTTFLEAANEKKYDYRHDVGWREMPSDFASANLFEQLRWIWRDYEHNPPPIDVTKIPADAPFGTPGTAWEMSFGGMSEPVTYEFRPNGVLYWVE